MKNAVKKRSVYLDDGKVKRAQRILKTQTDTETIDRALDLVVFRKEILRRCGRWRTLCGSDAGGGIRTGEATPTGPRASCVLSSQGTKIERL
jgi:hypothetical protein